ncbi:MAG: helix-turn-helix domain-containing protein [Dorea formicigenerans]|nr:MAG TPA: repressor protein [Caudoviricetes sp.]
MGENFNENLKEARLKSGLSQKDLSENIGVAKSTYSLYESGKREPNVDTIKKIASTLNVSADTLLGIDEEPTTLAAHFDGDEYTEDELDEIRQFAEFVKGKRGK